MARAIRNAIRVNRFARINSHLKPLFYSTSGRFARITRISDSQRESREFPIRANQFALETPIFIAPQADSHESLEFPIRANHANQFSRITPLSSLPQGPKDWKKKDPPLGLRQFSEQPPHWNRFWRDFSEVRGGGGRKFPEGGLNFLEVALVWKFPYGSHPKQSSKKFASEPPKLLRSPFRSGPMRKLVAELS